MAFSRARMAAQQQILSLACDQRPANAINVGNRQEQMNSIVQSSRQQVDTALRVNESAKISPPTDRRTRPISAGTTASELVLPSTVFQVIVSSDAGESREQ